MSTINETQGNIGSESETDLPISEDYGPVMIEIHVYDPVSKSTEMTKFVKVVNCNQDMTMGGIRQLLNRNGALNSRQRASPFCNKIGAVASEELLFKDYIKSLDRGQKANGESGSQDKKSQPQSEEEEQTVCVYLKTGNILTGMDEATKEYVRQKLDIELRKAELAKAGDIKLPDTLYDHSSWMAKAADNEPTYAVEMSEEQWDLVVRCNSLLHGSCVRKPAPGIQRPVQRAMYPAFTLKHRRFPARKVNLDNNNIHVPDQNLFIPRFIVNDESYVEVTESQSSVSRAIAQACLSEMAAEAAVGGGLFGYSFGAKGAYENEENAANSSRSATERKMMTITYNFPRVLLQLDEDSLELTDECRDDARRVETKDDVQAFKDKYGCFFTTRVELGGRLHATEESEAMGSQTIAERSKAMKYSAGVSFSSSFMQASGSYSSGSATSGSEERSESKLTSTLTWEAKGGDPLLCNNPAAWCNTVGPYKNWRVVKQDAPIAIEKLLVRVDPNLANIPLCRGISEKVDPTPTPPVPPGRRQGKITLCFKHQSSSKYLTVRPEPSRDASLCSKMLDDMNKHPHHSYIWGGLIPLLRDGHPRPLFLEAPDSTVPNSVNPQVFRVQGEMYFDENGQGKLINNDIYTITNTFTGVELKCTPTFPEYKTSYLVDMPNMPLARCKFVAENIQRDILDESQDCKVHWEFVGEGNRPMGKIGFLEVGTLGTSDGVDAAVFNLQYM
ncbi:hypothetical protein BDV38DRAFT_289224 [Aspergillus pseudotamarii]|uniref:MACPF-like domain-containing protein n=1 Tax=Aspergillus pseudotamarii TaxID=132259 RepID=A0A5N6SCP3_ASPPS|nr:uncharacterized protein BDV38DRAFT_289224 [Aspergillus pseudotamarii]KAE8130884.1 hypothetical protein BDV38DRAFT_289224 [Aspergillus pseudotamarii]